MRNLLATLRSIKPQIFVAYGVLAVVILVIVTGAVFVSRAYVRDNTIKIGELHTESRTVDGAGASTVEATIISGFGQMAVSGGAEDLLEIELVSNVPDMHPFIHYEVDDGVGDLIVSPSAPTGIPDPMRFAEYRNEWDVRLHSATPLNLEVVLGTGLGNFDFRGLTLTKLSVEVGTGESTIDMRGDWAQDFLAEIDSGTGKTTLLLPEDVGVRIEVDRMIGGFNVVGLEKLEDEYVNEAYGVSDVTLEIEVTVGTGELNLVVLDETAEYVEDWDVEKAQ